MDPLKRASQKIATFATKMSDTHLLIAALCVSPFISFLICAVLRSMELTHRENDTRRYPRYGQSDDMRDNGKFSVKRRYDDNET